jgi:hypothetical protein
MEGGRLFLVGREFSYFFFFFLKNIVFFCKDLKHHIHPPYPPFFKSQEKPQKIDFKHSKE